VSSFPRSSSMMQSIFTVLWQSNFWNRPANFRDGDLDSGPQCHAGESRHRPEV
jgi:hypothetical protein